MSRVSFSLHGVEVLRLNRPFVKAISLLSPEKVKMVGAGLPAWDDVNSLTEVCAQPINRARERARRRAYFFIDESPVVFYDNSIIKEGGKLHSTNH